MYSVNLFFLYFMILSYYILHSHVYYFRNFSPSLYLIAGSFEFVILIFKKMYFKEEILECESISAIISLLVSVFFAILWSIRKGFLKKSTCEQEYCSDHYNKMINFDSIDLKKTDILDLSSILNKTSSFENTNIPSEDEILGIKIKIANDHDKIDEIRSKMIKQEKILNEKLENMKLEIEKYKNTDNKDIKQAIHVIATQNACMQEKVLELKKKTDQIDYLEDKLNTIETKIDTNIDEVQDFVDKITGLIEVINIGIKKKHLLDN